MSATGRACGILKLFAKTRIWGGDPGCATCSGEFRHDKFFCLSSGLHWVYT